MSSVAFSGRGITVAQSGVVAVIRLSRSEKLNALTPEMRADLLAGLTAVEQDDSARAVVLTGEGRAFCAGGDIDCLTRLARAGDRDGFIRLLDEGTELVRRYRASPKPTVAAVNGPAIGGGLILALACDLRLAAQSAVLGMPFAKIGMGPDWGGTWMLTQLLGTARALEMLMSARLFTASEAAAAGLVNRVCPDDLLAESVQELAREISTFPADLLAGYKQAVYAAETGAFNHALAVERRRQLSCFDHPDFARRLAQFSKKEL